MEVTKSKQDDPVTHVTKHHTEQKGKGDEGKQPWIDFLVSRHTIGVDNFLQLLLDNFKKIQKNQ